MKTLSQIEAMTDEQRIVATAELCGLVPGLNGYMGPCWYSGRKEVNLPAYLTSLDAMHDARKHVPKELRNDYMDAIDEVVPLTEYTISQWNLLDASARDHNTAFLMTMMNDQPEKQ